MAAHKYKINNRTKTLVSFFNSYGILFLSLLVTFLFGGAQWDISKEKKNMCCGSEKVVKQPCYVAKDADR